jgi:hypothetical protein
METCIKVIHKFEPLRNKKEEHLRFDQLYVHIMKWGHIYYGSKFNFTTKEGLDTRVFARCPHCGEEFATDGEMIPSELELIFYSEDVYQEFVGSWLYVILKDMPPLDITVKMAFEDGVVMEITSE